MNAETQIVLFIPEEEKQLKKDLQTLADADKRSLSAYVRIILHTHVNKLTGEGDR